MLNHSLSLPLLEDEKRLKCGGILLTVVIPCFYPIKTINKALFWEGNPQTHSDLGTNNLVPHVLVIIWLQVLRIGILQCPKAPYEGWATNQVWPIDKPT